MATNNITYQIDVQSTAAVANVNSVTAAVNHLTTSLTTATAHLTTLLHTMSAANGLTTNLHANLTTATTATNAASQAHHAHATSMLATAAAYRVASFALETFISALGSIPTTGQAFEQINSTLTAIYVTSKDVNEQFKFLNDLADKTGGRIASLAEIYSKFSSSALIAGESVANVQSIFSNLTMAGTVLHLPTEKLKAALTAVDQMYGKGAVQLEELKRQLGNQLPAAVSVFARSMGVSTAELMKLTKAGVVVPKETIANFAEMYKTIFAPPEAFEKASQGMNASLGRLETAWTRLAGTIYEAISPALLTTLRGATSALDGMRHALEWLDKDTIKFGETSVSVFDVLKAGWQEATDALTSYGKAQESWVGKVSGGVQSGLGGALSWMAGGETPSMKSPPSLANALGAERFKAGATAGLGNVLYDIINPQIEAAIANSTVVARAARAKVAEEKVREAKAVEEKVLAEQRKVLLADPASEQSAELSAKAMSKALELSSKLGQSSIAQVAATARREMSVLEAQKASIDRQWQQNQLSIADYYAKQLDLVNKMEQVEEKKLTRQIAIHEAMQAQTREAEGQLLATETHNAELLKLKDRMTVAQLAIQTHTATVVEDRSPARALSPVALASLQAARDKYNSTEGNKPIPAGTPLVFYASEQLVATRKIADLTAKQTSLQETQHKVVSGAGSSDMMSFFTGKGWSSAQAAGIIANLKSESGLRANAVGDSGAAYGLAQWHPDRQANFAAAFGKNMKGSSITDQLEFVNYELTKGTEKYAGTMLKGAKTAQEAGAIVSKMYERPRDREGEASKRAALAATIASGGTVLKAGGSNLLASASASDIQSQMQIETLQDSILAAREKRDALRADLAARQADAERQFLKSLEQSNLEYAKLVGHSEAATAAAEYELQTRDRIEKLQLELNTALAQGNNDQRVRVEAVLEEMKATKEIAIARAEMKDAQSAGNAMESFQSSASKGGGGMTALGAAWQADQVAASLVDSKLANLQTQMALVKADVTLSPENKTAQLQNLFSQLEALQESGQNVANLFRDQITPIISDSFTAWVNGSKSATEALKSLGLSFTQMIQKMIIDELALQASKAVVSAGSSIGSAIMGMFASGGSVPAYASGGVHGTGTGLSDSILTSIPSGSFVVKSSSAQAIGHSTLAAVSNGEFIVPPSAAAYYGSGFWNSVNRTGRIQGFASGGAVGMAAGSNVNAAAGSVVNNFSVSVNHTGSESSEVLGEKINAAMVKAIAQAEAERVTRVNNKQRDMVRRRGG